MGKEQSQDAGETAELQATLKKRVVDIIAEMQNDIAHVRMLRTSKHAWEGACDDVFDAVEGALINTVKRGENPRDDEDACGAISEIAWAAVSFLDETAPARFELETLLNNKCAELVNGSAYGRWRAKRRTRQ